MMALITALRATQEQKLDMGLSVNLDYSLCKKKKKVFDIAVLL